MKATGSDYIITEEEQNQIVSTHLKDAQAYLDGLTGRLEPLGIKISTKIEKGRADECIVEYATRQHADMIVMATHGRSGISRWLIGSVAERVVRWSCIPVLIIRPEACIPQV
jgi:nucleotide-binding universal stress UspA family protein